jgi:hypothetical protein
MARQSIGSMKHAPIFLHLPTSLLHLSLFLTPLRPVATDPADGTPDFKSSRNRFLRLTSAGLRPCDSSQRSKSRK